MPGRCRWIPGVVAFAAAAGLLAEPALADKAMFRVSFRSLDAEGTFSKGVRPTLSAAPCGALSSMGSPLQCPPVEVGSTGPAARFTIPAKAFETYTTHSGTYFGYTTFSTLSSYNGRGLFQPNNPHGVTAYHRMVFPTTMGNAAPNLGSGNPVTPTTTFGGSFDTRRPGSAKITAGPNRFGGTIQFLFGPNARFKWKYEYDYYSPITGSLHCRATAGSGPGARHGPLQACDLSGTSKIGVIGSSRMGSRRKYTLLGYVAIPTSMYVNDLTYKSYELSTFAPWTTGMLDVQVPFRYVNTEFNTTEKIAATGYDGKFSPPTTRTFTYTNYNTTSMGTTTTTSMKTLKGITRITSLVRPRLRHTYFKSNNPLGDILTGSRMRARIWGLRVYFLPEPSSMILMGAGILGVVGLSALRRR